MKKMSVEFKLKSEKQNFPVEKISSSVDVYNYAKNFYFDDINIYESVFVILLNEACNTIGYAKISQGGVTNTCVDTKIVAKYAIESLSSSIVLVHNHPSGSLIPSRYDDNITSEVKKIMDLFNIKFLDHVIITDSGYYSYNDEGKL